MLLLFNLSIKYPHKLFPIFTILKLNIDIVVDIDKLNNVLIIFSVANLTGENEICKDRLVCDFVRDHDCTVWKESQRFIRLL